MLVSDFNYDLPEEVIAQHPPKVRGTTRLLALNRKTGETTDSYYKNLADFLEPGDLIILNDTKVMRSRVFTERKSDGHPRELVVLERHEGEIDHVMYRGKLHEGDRLRIARAMFGNNVSETVRDNGSGMSEEPRNDGRDEASRERHYTSAKEQYGLS